MRRPPARCIACQDRRVAWVSPRVDYCYACLPGGPFVAPPCRSCDSHAYFSDGLCGRCHPGGPGYLDACRGCLGWGVTRAHGFRCWVCRWWSTHYPIGDCVICRRTTRVSDRGACRLCLEQARVMQEPGRGPDLARANEHGQQLFLANMRFQRPRSARLDAGPRKTGPGARGGRPTGPTQRPLFRLDADPDVIRARLATADHDLASYCKEIVHEHAARHGWSKRQRNDVIRSLRLLHALRDTPSAKINATDVLELPRYDGNIQSTLDVLAAADLLDDDRLTPVERYFAAKTSGLPATITRQLEVWLDAMLNGSTTAPRQRSRDPQTVRIQIMGIAPIIHAWAAAGHQSLAEITRDDIRNALPTSGSRRNFAEVGLRSLFAVLKSRKLVFTNPTRGLPTTPVNSSIPLPLDTTAIRHALSSPDPAIALAIALVAFHALTSHQLRALAITDIVDGRLTLNERELPLAAPVRDLLRAWLDHRNQTWPGSINPHLFVTRRSAPRLVPVGAQFPWRGTNLKPQALREDRILQEIHASGGDVRRISDLFGLTVQGAIRYSATLEPPAAATNPTPVPPTRDERPAHHRDDPPVPDETA